MNPKTVKKALKDAIQAMTDYKWLFSARPGKDNTRNRKFPIQKVIPYSCDLNILFKADFPIRFVVML